MSTWLIERKDRLFFASKMLILTGIAIGIIFYLRPSVKNTNDLSTITGKIVWYSFVDGLRGSYNYVIHLNNFTADFVIPAEFVGEFSKNKFLSELREGNLISVTISKQNFVEATSEKRRIVVFGIHTNTNVYLNEADTLSTYNSPFILIICGLFVLTGASVLFWRAWDAKNK